MIKKLIRFGVAMFILFCVVVGGGSVYVYLHQDEIKQIALNKLNESVDATFLVSGSDVSLFRSFPSVSVNFHEPLLLRNSDTLLMCENLQLKLNLADFVKKDYRIRTLSLKNGDVHLKNSMSGDPNYIIWHTSAEESSELFNFEIEDIIIENVKLHYEDLPISHSYLFDIKQIKADLLLKKDQWLIKLDGHLKEFTYTEDHLIQLAEQNLKIATEFIYDEIAEELNFTGYDITNENIFVHGKGKINLIEGKKDIDIAFNAEGNPNGILGIFKHYYELPLNYEIDGEVAIKSSLYYKMGQASSLLMQNKVNISKGRIKETTNKERVENITYQGDLNITGEKYDLKIESLSCEMHQGNLIASGAIDNLKKPNANLQIQGKLNLDEVSSFLALDGISMEGELHFNNLLKGEYSTHDFEANQWLNKSIFEGKATLEQAKFALEDHNIRIIGINGNLEFNNEDISVTNLTGTIENTNFQLNGELLNVLSYLTSESEILEIDAYLEADEIDLNNFISSTEKSIRQSKLEFPENLKFKLNSNIENLLFNTFRAENINGVLTYGNKTFEASQVAFNSCDGKVIGDLSIIDKNGYFQVESYTSIMDLSITRIFESFGEFDQDFITSKHLSGVTTSTCYFKGSMNPSLNFNKESIETTADIQISNGQLINHPPMQEISVYLRKKSLLNPFLKVDELEKNLKHLSFNTLENRIEIKNGMINIPKMAIQSNAMDANITGKHSFNHEIDYKIDFRMREMLKEREVEIEEIIVEDDGTGSRIFLAMTGMADNPDISFDKDSARAKRKSDIQNAKDEFLNIFKKKENKEAVSQNEIKMELDEEQPDSIVVSNKKKKGLKKLLDNIAKKEKEPEDVDFEIVDDED